MLTYKNARSGGVVTIAEPTEVEEAADAEAMRIAKGGTRKAQAQADRVSVAGHKQAIHVRHTIERMDASEKWQRHTPPAPQPPPPPETAESAAQSAEPETAEVRAWAKAEGIDVSARGKLPQEIVDQYVAATTGGEVD